MHTETHIKIKEKIDSLKNIINEYGDSLDKLKYELTDQDEIEIFINVMDLAKMLKQTYSSAEKTGWTVDKFLKCVESDNSKDNG